MRTLGLIGGMTWHSTLDYYRLINEGVSARLGGAHSAEMVLRSVDFGPVEVMQNKGDWASLGRAMAIAARTVEIAGARGLVICANTMHLLADDVARAVKIPLIHVADATAGAIRDRGLHTIGLLGTRYTMEMDFYRGRLAEKHGLEILVPDDAGRAVVHDVIYKELARGLVREESRQIYISVIEEMARRGAEGVILGCTEIPTLIKDEDSPVPIFDTTRLHAAAAVNFALEG